MVYGAYFVILATNIGWVIFAMKISRMKKDYDTVHGRTQRYGWSPFASIIKAVSAIKANEADIRARAEAIRNGEELHKWNNGN